MARVNRSAMPCERLVMTCRSVSEHACRGRPLLIPMGSGMLDQIAVIGKQPGRSDNQSSRKRVSKKCELISNPGGQMIEPTIRHGATSRPPGEIADEHCCAA